VGASVKPNPSNPCEVVHARVLTGAQPYERFKSAIDALLEQASSQSK